MGPVPLSTHTRVESLSSDNMASTTFVVLSAVVCILVVEANAAGGALSHGRALSHHSHGHGVEHGVHVEERHGVEYGRTYSPGYASGVTHYDTYGTGPSSGHTNLHTYSRDYKTPLYKTVHYKGHLHHGDSYGHHGAYGHQGYGHTEDHTLSL